MVMVKNMNFRFKTRLLISMLLIGAIFGIAFYAIIIPFFSYSLIHCLLMGIAFGLINFFVSNHIYQKYECLKKSNEQLQVDVQTDKLTGVLNRRTFDMDMKGMHIGQIYSMLFVDIDNFRMFNNQYGHPVGDMVLKRVCESMQFDLRAIDRVYRYGGEEFLILLKGCRKEDAYNIAEKLRLNINKLDNSPYPGITISIGISAFPEDSTQIKEVLEMCDQALLTAKKLGKNRTYVYTK